MVNEDLPSIQELVNYFKEYKDLPSVRKTQIVSLAKSLDVSFKNPRPSSFRCPELGMTLATNCSLKTCSFFFKNKSFFNCALFYREKLNLKELNLFDLGVLFKTSPVAIEHDLKKISIKIQKSLLNEKNERDLVAKTKIKRSIKTLKLEKKFSVNIETLIQNCLELYSDVSLITTLLGIKKSKFIFYCERYLKIPFDKCLIKFNLNKITSHKRRTIIVTPLEKELTNRLKRYAKLRFKKKISFKPLNKLQAKLRRL